MFNKIKCFSNFLEIFIMLFLIAPKILLFSISMFFSPTFACTPTASGDDDGGFEIGRQDDATTSTRQPTAGTITSESSTMMPMPSSSSTGGSPSENMMGGAIISPPLIDCRQCAAQLPIRRTDINSRTIRQTLGSDPLSGCETLTLSCTGVAQDSATIFTYYNSAGDDVGSTFGSGAVSATLNCNSNDQWSIGANGANVVVNEVECISS